MSTQNSGDLDLTALKDLVDEIQRRIREDEDPVRMTAARNAFRSSVPFFMRSYVAGYLLQQVASQGRIRHKMTTTALFVSIGKNRRVYPRDLIQLFVTTGGIPKADIGDIKILDNYSFVEVEVKQVAGLIKKLDGLPYRGRPLTVNLAKKQPTEAERSPADALA